MILAKKDVFRRSPAPKKPVGVVEAAGSNPVTQTRKTGIVRFPFFLYFQTFSALSGADFFVVFALKNAPKMIENEVGT